MPRAVAVLSRDPELGEDLGEDELARASERAIARVLEFPLGPWRVGPDDFHPAANLGLLLLDGLLTRGLTVAEYTCAEILGPGDVLQPWFRIGPDQSVATEVDWEVVQPTQAALLDRNFCIRVAEWPEITAAVARRLMQRSHWLAFHLAVCGLRRIDDRVLLILWHFADRWGRVTPEGVRLDLRLTHEVIAAAVGARRPSVSAAVGRLSEQGRLKSRPRSRWLLLGPPPAELQRIHAERSRSFRAPFTQR